MIDKRFVAGVVAGVVLGAGVALTERDAEAHIPAACGADGLLVHAASQRAAAAIEHEMELLVANARALTRLRDSGAEVPCTTVLALEDLLKPARSASSEAGTALRNAEVALLKCIEAGNEGGT